MTYTVRFERLRTARAQGMAPRDADSPGGSGRWLLGRLFFGASGSHPPGQSAAGSGGRGVIGASFVASADGDGRGFLFMLNVNIYRLLAVCQREVLRRGKGRFGHAAVGKRVDADGAHHDGSQRPQLPLLVERRFPGVMFGQEDHPRKEFKAPC